MGRLLVPRGWWAVTARTVYECDECRALLPEGEPGVLQVNAWVSGAALAPNNVNRVLHYCRACSGPRLAALGLVVARWYDAAPSSSSENFGLAPTRRGGGG